MTSISAFRVAGIYEPQRQRAQIENLQNTPGVVKVEANLDLKIVTFVHDKTVNVEIIENLLKSLRLTPTLISAGS